MADTARSACPPAVGIDVGGTKVLGVVVDLSDPAGPQILRRVREPVPTGGPGDAADLAGRISALVERLVAQAERDQATGRDQTDGTGRAATRRAAPPVGIGVAGYVDRRGVVTRSPNVPQAVGVDLVSEIRERCGIEVTVDNDANCVATAASAWRRPQVADLVAITFGTGIGGGLVVGGELVRGARGFAGEPGHMVVMAGGRRCPCGQRGCWERYASGTALGELARGRAGGPSPPGNGELLVEAARGGDPRALELLTEHAGYVALGIANLVNLLDPALVVISGGVALALDVLIGPIEAALAANPTVSDRVPAIEVAPFADAAGAVGAATAAALAQR